MSDTPTLGGVQGSPKQIEWAERIIASARQQAADLIRMSEARVAAGDMGPEYTDRVRLVTMSLMQDLIETPHASTLIDRYGRTSVRLEPVVLRVLGSWTADVETKLRAKLSASKTSLMF